MTLVLKNRVKQYTSTTGISSFVLDTTAPGFQAFSVIGDGNTTYYTAKKDSDWEVGIGTYTLSTTTLARTTILASSNNGSAVSFGTGLKEVICCYPAEKAVTTDQTLGVSSGGTGTNTTFTQGSVLFAGASGTYSQDNTNLFWDDTNNRLGINAAGAPTSSLTVRHNSTSTNAIDFLTDTGDGSGYVSRFRIENNASQAAVDLNLRGVEVNVGSHDPSESASADMRFLQPTGGTTNLVQIFPPGRNPAVNGNPAAYFGPNGNLVLQVGGLSSTAMSVKTAGDAQNKFTLSETGAVTWGPGGSTAGDTNLYRNAANELKTDDALVVAGNLTCSGSILSPTLVTPALGTPASGVLTNCTGLPFNAGLTSYKGTSFPVSPSTNDLFYRTDRALEYYYDGTRWLTTFTIPVETQAFLSVNADTTVYGSIPYAGTYSVWLDSWSTSMRRSAAGEWDFELGWVDSANVITTLDTQDGSGDSDATWYARSRSLGSVLTASARAISFVANEISGSALFSGAATLYCRLVG